MQDYDYKQVLNSYTYAGDEEIIDRIKACTGENERENRDIINSIVLWKVNRQVNIGEIFHKVKKLNVVDYNDFLEKETKVKDIVGEILQVDGVRIAMASTILKMFYPNVFPIIDQRAYRELYGDKMPQLTGKKSIEHWKEAYVKYVKDCHKYYLDNCNNQIAFSALDKVLYQIDKKKGGNENLKGY